MGLKQLIRYLFATRQSSIEFFIHLLVALFLLTAEVLSVFVAHHFVEPVAQALPITHLALALPASAIAPRANRMSSRNDGSAVLVPASNAAEEDGVAAVGKLVFAFTGASSKTARAMNVSPKSLQQRLQQSRKVQTLLPIIATWLATNFDLPATENYPQVQFVPPEKLHAMRFGGQESGQVPASTLEASGLASRSKGIDVEALYSNSSQTIFLREEWSGAKPAETSVLVHEMVHHLQNLAELQYECAQAREELAYAAQARWLARSGRNIMREFNLNPMTLLVRTKCIF